VRPEPSPGRDPRHDSRHDSRHDIEGRDDVAALVTDFYGRAFADPLIGPIFTDVARMDLAAHLPIMCDFWESVLFRTGAYRRNALAVHRDLHAKVPLTPAHFERWHALWTATVDDRHAGERAEHAKVQAGRVADSILRRLTEPEDRALLTIERGQRSE
jgi:hemoglobin